MRQPPLLAARIAYTWTQQPHQSFNEEISMNIDQAIELLTKRKETHGGEMELTTLEYAGGNDAPCDIVDFEFDEETQTLRAKTMYR
jgi:hypothetical protein